MYEVPVLDHDLVNDGLVLFEKFAAEIENLAAIERLQPFEHRYRSGMYRLVLVGEENRGKSSLVSALLGTPDLLPVGPEPMTACVFKIIYGEKMQHRIFFLPKDPDDPEATRPSPLDVLPEEVADYGSEVGNPNNEKRVDFIAVEHPHALLKAGLTIIDLPGLGGLKREHGLLTLSYLPNADAAFFVIDSVSSALTREEMATLDLLKEFTNHVLFVQTKTDAVSEMQWQSWRERNIEEIERRMEIERDTISYFTVSSKLKNDYDRSGNAEDLADSGFAPLLAVLENDLIPRKHDRLAVPMLATLIQEVADLARPIENEITILSVDTEAELKRMEETLRTGQNEFEAWKGQTWPRVLSQFKQEYREAVLSAQTSIATDLDAGAYGPIVGTLISEIVDQNVSAADMEASSAAYNDGAIALCGRRLDHIGVNFEEETLKAYNRAAEKIGEAAQSVLIERPGIKAAPALVGHRMAPRAGIWATAMQGRMGFMVGSMAGGLVASMLFPPLGLAALAATAIGGLFGASRSIIDGRKREREVALNQLRGLLSDTVRRMAHRSMLDFNAAAERNQNTMIEALQLSVSQREDNERSAFSAIEERRRTTREQTQTRIKILTARLQQASAILTVLGRAGVPISDETVRAAA